MRYLLPLVRHGFLFFLLLSLASCINDDLSDCPPPFSEVESRIRFTYVPYSEVTNEGFDARELEHITVFAFDSQGRFVTSVTDDAPRLGETDYSLALSLLPGRYDFYAWGNIRDCYTYTNTDLIPGETTIETLGVNYTRPADDTVRVAPHPFFFASRTQVDIAGPSPTRSEVHYQEIVLPMVKNTYDVHIRLTGLTPNHHLAAVVTDNNSSYKFDNGFINTDYLNYYKVLGWQANIQKHAGLLTTLRLERNRSPLFKLYNRETGKALYYEDLIDLLLASEDVSGKRIDFSRQHIFTIDLIFSEGDETGKMKVCILVNDWEVVVEEVILDFSNPNLPF